MPIYSTEENDRRFQEEIDKTSKSFGMESPAPKTRPPENSEAPRLPETSRPHPSPLKKIFRLRATLPLSARHGKSNA